MYLFTTVAYLPDVSPWIMVFVACAAPIASAVLLDAASRLLQFCVGGKVAGAAYQGISVVGGFVLQYFLRQLCR